MDQHDGGNSDAGPAEQIVGFLRNHSADDDEWSDVVGLPCHHFAAFLAALPVDDGTHTPAQAELGVLSPLSQFLAHSGLSESWIVSFSLVEWGENLRVARWSYLRALYGVVESRLLTKSDSCVAALELANLVETVVGLELDLVKESEAFHYAPRWDLWWKQYMEMIDACLTAPDLESLSSRSGYPTYTESMSSVTKPARLAELHRLAPDADTGVAANASLPADVVNQAVEHDTRLLFHPNVEPSRSWTIIESLLNSGEDPLDLVASFDNFRDDTWVEFAAFHTHGPLAEELRAKIADWCRENELDDLDDEIRL
jgi:hypothetical protein